MVEKLCEPGITRDILYSRIFRSPTFAECVVNNVVVDPRIFKQEGMRYPVINQ